MRVNASESQGHLLTPLPLSGSLKEEVLSQILIKELSILHAALATNFPCA